MMPNSTKRDFTVFGTNRSALMIQIEITIQFLAPETDFNLDEYRVVVGRENETCLRADVTVCFMKRE